MDSGLHTGIEPFTMRNDVSLFGVCPEKCIKYPVIKEKHDDEELSSGHTHLFLINNDGDVTDEENMEKYIEEHSHVLNGKPIKKDEKK